MIDKHTDKLLLLLKRIIEFGNSNKLSYFISGGFAVDIYLGYISRSHKDIELFSPEIEKWSDFFKEKGLSFKQSDNSEKGFIIKDPKEKKGKLVDLIKSFDLNQLVKIYSILLESDVMVIKKDKLIEYKEKRLSVVDIADLKLLKENV